MPMVGDVCRYGSQVFGPLDVEHLVVKVDVRFDFLQQRPFGGPGQEQSLVDLQAPAAERLQDAGPGAGRAAGRHQRASHQSPVLATQRTVVINAVYEANSDLGVVVGHQDDIKELLAVRVELPESRVDGHQRLCERTDRYIFLSATMLKRVRDETAMVTAYWGLGCEWDTWKVTLGTSVPLKAVSVLNDAVPQCSGAGTASGTRRPLKCGHPRCCRNVVIPSRDARVLSAA
ncbi:hypothetical protein EYF80_037418 [Liparis tanakae]|uniref:Uncharacterized protein n=1 Tax=Liparis tanakae TaxID=230148 RepID=A0A4Z2GGY5_9TELE|nr:hypothetical protein EYF80_037418 [Liparis tanakae]